MSHRSNTGTEWKQRCTRFSSEWKGTWWVSITCYAHSSRREIWKDPLPSPPLNIQCTLSNIRITLHNPCTICNSGDTLPTPHFLVIPWFWKISQMGRKDQQ
ncbi:hypothetical protein FKM82_021880 [Ascaphus truei]